LIKEAYEAGLAGRRQDPRVMKYAEERPMINIEKFIEPRKLNILKTAGLHKVTAALEKVATGRDVGNEINLPIAIHLLGERIFTKKAQTRQIFNGISAYRELRRDV